MYHRHVLVSLSALLLLVVSAPAEATFSAKTDPPEIQRGKLALVEFILPDSVVLPADTSRCIVTPNKSLRIERWWPRGPHRIGLLLEANKDAVNPGRIDVEVGGEIYVAQLLLTEGDIFSAYEPNRVGWTWDGDDTGKGYLDFTLSSSIKLFHGLIPGAVPKPYLGFTGRFGQYVGSRDSSPVVAKRFNPKIFFRIDGVPGYIDIGYAHESNGQSIDCEGSDEECREAFDTIVAQSGESRDQVRDRLSRGWDYLEFRWHMEAPIDHRSVSMTFAFQHFLTHGPLFQGGAEEYEAWEDDGPVLRRREVDGIIANFLVQSVRGRDVDPFGMEGVTFGEWKLALILRTGYENVRLDNSTVTIEAGMKAFSLPVVVWARRGRMSDLARYNKHVTSTGVAIELGSF